MRQTTSSRSGVPQAQAQAERDRRVREALEPALRTLTEGGDEKEKADRCPHTTVTLVRTGRSS